MFKKRETVEKSPMEKAKGDIAVAYVLGFLSAGFTLTLYFLSRAGIRPLGTYNRVALIIGLIVAVLALGIMVMKSRICACLLFVLFCLDKLVLFMDYPGQISTALVSTIIWASGYFAGIRGTFAYHKLKKQPQMPSYPPTDGGLL